MILLSVMGNVGRFSVGFTKLKRPNDVKAKTMPTDNDFGKPKSALKKDKHRCPSLLKYIGSQGIENGLKTRPGLLAEICRQVASQGPFNKEIYERFMRNYWDGVGLLVAKSPQVKQFLARIMPLTVNLEATDTSLLGHFQICDGCVHGGPGMVAFRDQDFRFFGSTRVLMLLLNNELPLGYANLDLHSEGHPGLGRILFPVMRIIAQLTIGT
jgi:hypothetical protein